MPGPIAPKGVGSAAVRSPPKPSAPDRNARHVQAVVLREIGERFLLSVKLAHEWIEIEYQPSADERDVLESNLGASVRAILTGETIVAVYV